MPVRTLQVQLLQFGHCALAHVQLRQLVVYASCVITTPTAQLQRQQVRQAARIDHQSLHLIRYASRTITVPTVQEESLQRRRHLPRDVELLQSVRYVSAPCTARTAHVQRLQRGEVLSRQRRHEGRHVSLVQVVACASVSTRTPTENLHVLHVGIHSLAEHGRHILHPRRTATRAVRQQVRCVQTRLVLHQQLELLVLDGLCYA